MMLRFELRRKKGLWRSPRASATPRLVHLASSGHLDLESTSTSFELAEVARHKLFCRGCLVTPFSGRSARPDLGVYCLLSLFVFLPLVAYRTTESTSCTAGYLRPPRIVYRYIEICSVLAITLRFVLRTTTRNAFPTVLVPTWSRGPGHYPDGQCL